MTKTKNSTTASDPRLGYFDRHAAGWDDAADRIARTLARLDACRELLALAPGEAVLEVGCGTGQITGWLARAVAPGRVLAVDFAGQMVRRARAKGIDADFSVLDICAAAPPGGPFDLALCFHSFPHFRDRPAALSHLAGVLRRGGRLLIMHVAGRDRVNAMHAGFGGPVADDRLPDAGEWPALLAPAGLALDELIDRDDLFFLRACK